MIKIKFVTEHRVLPANSLAAGLRDRILKKYNFDLGPIIWSLAETEKRAEQLGTWDPLLGGLDHSRFHATTSGTGESRACCGLADVILKCVTADGENRGDTKTAREFSNEIADARTEIDRVQKKVNSAFEPMLRAISKADTQATYRDRLPLDVDRSIVEKSFDFLQLILEGISIKTWEVIPTTNSEDRKITRRPGPPKRELLTDLWNILKTHGVTPAKYPSLLPDLGSAKAMTLDQTVNAHERNRDRNRYAARKRKKRKPKNSQ